MSVKIIFRCSPGVNQFHVSHLSQVSSRSSQSQQQAATWLRSPSLFTYSQQHKVSSSSRTLLARFFMTDSLTAYQIIKRCISTIIN